MWYVFGLARTPRLVTRIENAMRAAVRQGQRTGRGYPPLHALHPPHRQRLLVGRAAGGGRGGVPPGANEKEKENPHFLATNLPADRYDDRTLYEKVYCARDDMENQLKEQGAVAADRTSTATMRGNQLRLTLSSLAYTLLYALRRLGLRRTAMAQAQCQTLRLKLLKIGARIRITARRVVVAFAEHHPSADLFRRTHATLVALPGYG